jgi:hypothetical protein
LTRQQQTLTRQPPQNNLQTQKEYQVFNYIIGGILILLFGYAAFWGPGTSAVACVYVQMTGTECATCGITRAFKEILHFRFHAAYQFNQLSFYLFTFFFVQLMVRLFINFWGLQKMPLKKVRTYDISFSVLLFIVCFYQLILLQLL